MSFHINNVEHEQSCASIRLWKIYKKISKQLQRICLDKKDEFRKIISQNYKPIQITYIILDNSCSFVQTIVDNICRQIRQIQTHQTLFLLEIVQICHDFLSLLTHLDNLIMLQQFMIIWLCPSSGPTDPPSPPLSEIVRKSNTYSSTFVHF